MEPEKEKDLSMEEQREAAKQNRIAAQQNVHRQGLKQKRLLQLGGIFLVAALVIGIFVVLNNSFSGGKADQVTASENIALLNKLPQNNLVVGDANAPVTVTEYADLQCPVCKTASESIVPYVLQKYVQNGKVKFVFHNWQVIGPDSATAASATLAAGKQNKAWQFIENWYKNQGQENSGYVTDEFVNAVAKESKLDMAKFEADLKSLEGATRAHLDQADTDAKNYNLTGTPSFVVSGKGQPEIITALPEESQIDQAIQKVSP